MPTSDAAHVYPERSIPGYSVGLDGLLAKHLLDISNRNATRLNLDNLRVSPDDEPARNAVACLTDHLTVRLSPSRIYLALFRHDSRDANAPCPECLDRRLLAMQNPDEQWAMHNGGRWEGCDFTGYFTLPVELIGLVARHLLEQPKSTTRQTVLSLDLSTHSIRVDELIRDPFCRSCPPPEVPNQETATLALRPSLPATHGKSRMRGLLDYALPHRALVNPVCGAIASELSVGYVQSVTAPVFAGYVQRAFDAAPRVVGWSGLCLRTDESRVAGMLEALERQAGMLAHPASTAIVDSYRNLTGQAMDPHACFAYNDEAYALPLGLSRFSDDLPIEWVWGYSLMSRQALLVPKQLAFYHRIETNHTTKLVDNNSSGCALGSCYEEAILKALLELIERDSFVIAWHRQLCLPKIDPESCTDYRTACIVDRIRHLHYDISLLDGRLDMQTPSVIAVARRRNYGLGAMAVGASASADPHDAVRSALLECATAISEMPAMFEKRAAHVRQLADDYYRVKSVIDHSLLYAIPEMAAKLKWLDGSSTQFAPSRTPTRMITTAVPIVISPKIWTASWLIFSAAACRRRSSSI